jgi:hypothetical protein
VWPGDDHVRLRGGSLGERGPGGAEERAQGYEITQPAGAAASWAYEAGLGV